jgi:VPDSG-CTERM motif
MKVTKFGTLLAGTLAMGLYSTSAALVDITVADPYTGSGDKYFTDGTPVNAPSGYREDNEVENNAIADQSWDLEAFVISTANKSLSIVSGFDMKTGHATSALAGSKVEFEMGDIFIRFNSPVDHNNSGAQSGYDYVIRLNQVRDTTKNPNTSTPWDKNYSVYSANNVTSVVSTAPENGGGGALHAGLKWYANATTGALKTGVANYADDKDQNWLFANSYNKYAGTTHDVASNIDLSWLMAAAASKNYAVNSVYFYTTMQCGNDVLSGKISGPNAVLFVPDGGATVMLMGAGLTALGLVRRRIVR